MILSSNPAKRRRSLEPFPVAYPKCHPGERRSGRLSAIADRDESGPMVRTDSLLEQGDSNCRFRSNELLRFSFRNPSASHVQNRVALPVSFIEFLDRLSGPNNNQFDLAKLGLGLDVLHYRQSAVVARPDD
jgi:hypothetical protein